MRMKRRSVRTFLSVILSLMMLGFVSSSSEVTGAPRLGRAISSPPHPVSNQGQYIKTAHRLAIKRPHFGSPPKRRVRGGRAVPPKPAWGDGNAGTDLGVTTGLARAVGYYAAHTADPGLELGSVQAPAFLYAPTGMNANTCLEWTTAYTRYPGDTQTTRAVWVWDHCVTQGIATSILMDSTFINNYLSYYNGGNVFWVELLQTAPPDGSTSVTYDAMIYNFTTNQWDLAYELISGMLPDTSGGWSVHENDLQDANICPSLSPILADQVQVMLGGNWTYATPSNSNTFATGWCYTNAPAYSLQVLAPNYRWQVTTR